jgi:hypothetical protein
MKYAVGVVCVWKKQTNHKIKNNLTFIFKKINIKHNDDCAKNEEKDKNKHFEML